MRRITWIKWIGTLLLMFASATTAAADTNTRSVEDSRAESFQSVKGPVAEEVSGGLLLGIAYAALWLALMLYLLRIERLSSRIGIRLDQMEATSSTRHDAKEPPIAIAE